MKTFLAFAHQVGASGLFVSLEALSYPASLAPRYSVVAA